MKYLAHKKFKNVLFIIIILVSIKECDVKVKDFCNNKKLISKELECQGNYNLSCSGILCAKDQAVES